jgi:hypothetical protein
MVKDGTNMGSMKSTLFYSSINESEYEVAGDFYDFNDPFVLIFKFYESMLVLPILYFIFIYIYILILLPCTYNVNSPNS